MTDREKVIKGMRQHVEGSMFDRCGECPYYEFGKGGFSCRDELLYDALALLKEQEKRINELEEKLRLLEYGDQDTLKSGLMPAT